MGDSYFILWSNYAFSHLTDNQFFTTRNTIKGYFPIEINKVDCEKTALNSHIGQYKFHMLLFGPENAPTIYQILINKILRELGGTAALC